MNVKRSQFALNGHAVPKAPVPDRVPTILQEISDKLQPGPNDAELKLMRALVERADKISAQIDKIEPEITVQGPAPEPRIDKWSFELKRDFRGELTEIIATAIQPTTKKVKT